MRKIVIGIVAALSIALAATSDAQAQRLRGRVGVNTAVNSWLNTGYVYPGYYNSGYYYPGSYSSGYYYPSYSGYYNSGYYMPSYYNSGFYNSGYYYPSTSYYSGWYPG